MIRIKKLSTKLLIGLSAMVLGLLVWQVIFSKRAINDMGKTNAVQTVVQAQELLRSGELKTFRRVVDTPFSTLYLDGTNILLFKGEEYAVYVSTVIRDSVDVRMNNDTLHISFTSVGNWSGQWMPILVSMPTEPKRIHSLNSNRLAGRPHKILGFEGKNTLLSYENAFIWLETDMSYINIEQKFGEVAIYQVLGSNVQVDAHIKNGYFRLFDRRSDSISLNMRLQESIGSFDIHSRSNVGTLSVTGTLNEHRWLWYRERRSTFQHFGQVDSLTIQLVNNMQATEILYLATNLSGRYENIDISGTIFIERRNDLMWGRNKGR